MIAPDDLKYEVIYLATGTTQSPGGQYAGTPPTAVRVTHLPTGLVAQAYQRSQHRARGVAVRMIEAALTDPQFRPE